MKNPLIHVPLEGYKQRYTEYLGKLEAAAFKRYGFNYSVVLPAQKDSVSVIRSGSVLDSVNRPLWAMKQMEMLLTRPGDLESVYFSDFFHPGLECLPYARKHPKAYSFLWAQTFDRYDFTRPMVPWMRPWEIMAFEIYQTVFVACDELKDLIVSALPYLEDRIVVVGGLPYDSQYVLDNFGPTNQRTDHFDVVYSSRWDVEKNPGIFVSLCESRPDLRFVVCTGNDSLKGSAHAAVNRAMHLAGKRNPNLTVLTNLTKAEYYAVLAASTVQFNCASQDWVSYTLLEALTFGCKPLYPAHRSFPSVFLWDNRYLYRPYDIIGASKRLDELLGNATAEPTDTLISIVEESDKVLSKISDHISHGNA